MSRVAHKAGLSWSTVMRMLTTTLDLDSGVDHRHVRHLGVDEHRFRTVRYLRDPDTHAVTRVEPWSIVFTDLDDGAILDVVDRRRGATVKKWLAARPRWWRRRVQLVALDMSSEFRAAVRKALPKARISVDHCPVVRLANEMLTKVRRRRVWELHERRGRATDTPWKHRKLLTCAGDKLSVRQRTKLQEILAEDIELAVAWGIKEHVRQLLAARDTPSFQRAWAKLERAVKATRLAEPAGLFRTLRAWRRELLTFCRTRVTNARTEAANLTARRSRGSVGGTATMTTIDAASLATAATDRGVTPGPRSKLKSRQSAPWIRRRRYASKTSRIRACSAVKFSCSSLRRTRCVGWASFWAAGV
ncbi:Transposase [Ornithinimicrobium cerasi]|uniref:Transposase n=1 Tax=Ornithinimicrobium cerasi TaxID=2248773 RepID=A0A285VUR8_9MICO|nr:Transposase [Ornithinimicrobium cerasi]